ncbi:MAG: hypothetical protein FD133_1118 [Erysipelotrichaceae bacterium]|nr:MAG: hypothetical protein FD179_576 [Erysipelotrichaceae bacterium]TXT17986.1 MAG: hypothetical protein FD133_1118 [Erysipelotrichaceae bacterium]
MVLIQCSVCGKEFPENASFCPNCGSSVQAKSVTFPLTEKDSVETESKLILYGYPGVWAVETMLKVYIDDDKVGEIGSIQKSSPIPFVYDITKDCVLYLTRPFAFLHKKISYDIKMGEITMIQPEWNRVTGRLDLYLVTPETIKK